MKRSRQQPAIERGALYGRRLLRRAVWWACVGAVARSRRPARLLARPLPGLAPAAVIVPLTVASLLASEFATHILVAELASTARLFGRGAYRSRSGRLGTLIAVAGWALLIRARADARRAGEVLDQSLRTAMGDDYRAVLPPDATDGPSATVREIWFPRFTQRSRYLRHEDLCYGPLRIRNNLDIWRRADLPLDGRAPVLLQIHGSAWVTGSKRGQGYPLMAHMSERGWVCVAINYSLAPATQWPAHIIDVKRAIAWAKHEIAQYGGDPDFIAVTGGSAGGHLSALAALTPNDPAFQPGFEGADTSVQAAVPLYGVYDLLDRAGDSPPQQEKYLTRVVIGASPNQAYQVWDSGSPLSHLRPDAPPMFVIHGSIDTFTNPEQARAFAGALAAVSNNPVAYAELPGAQHSFDVLPTERTVATVRAIDRFLTFVHQTTYRKADPTNPSPPPAGR